MSFEDGSAVEVESSDSSARPLFRSAEARSFRELAHAWLAVESRRLVAPENERRHIEHLKSLWRFTEAELTPREVRKALVSLLRPCGNLGPATVNKVRHTGRRVIREAQLNGEWRGPNPFRLVKPMKQEAPRYHLLTPGQFRRALRHLRRDRQREILFNVTLGPRPGETWALRKEDVDTRRRLVVIQRSNGRDVTKTGRIRVVPVPRWLWPLVEEALRDSPRGCPYVFPAPNGKRQSTNSRLSKVLRTALVAAGVVEGYRFVCRRSRCGYRDRRPKREGGAKCPKCGMRLYQHGIPPPVRWYDARHWAATFHRLAGCDPLVIQLALGHTVRNVTDRIYTHLPLSYVRKELSKFRLWHGPARL